MYKIQNYPQRIYTEQVMIVNSYKNTSDSLGETQIHTKNRRFDLLTYSAFRNICKICEEV